jgi:hypothetical protein
MTVDVLSLAASAACIAGLAVALAAVSYSAWLARDRGIGVAAAFATPPFRAAWSAGLLLAGIGWATLRRGVWWEVGICLVLAASLAWDLIGLARTWYTHRT